MPRIPRSAPAWLPSAGRRGALGLHAAAILRRPRRGGLDRRLTAGHTHLGGVALGGPGFSLPGPPRHRLDALPLRPLFPRTPLHPPPAPPALPPPKPPPPPPIPTPP